MRIAVEVGWGNKAGGARRVAFKGLCAMIALAPDNEYLLYCNTAQQQLPDAVKQTILPPPSGIPQVLWDQLLFPQLAVPKHLRRDDPDVVLHTNNLMPVTKSAPRVVIIHDMTPFLIPKSYHRTHALYQRAYIRHAAKQSDRILTDSENSRSDICCILGIPDEKVVVAPLAGNLDSPEVSVPAEKRGRGFAAGRPYILYVGAIHPRKNVGRIVEAFSMLKRERALPHRLLIAGAKRWLPEKREDVERLRRLGKEVMFTGPVSDAELVDLFRNCETFVYPSLYEGFGLPVLEAMSLGAPVVTSNVSSLPEVAGDAALQVDPLDSGQIAAAIWRIVDQPGLAAELREKGLLRAAQFSWEGHARIVLDTLAAVAR